jgi:hypothetical protein
MTTTYESVNVGDTLPILVKWETAFTIGRFAATVAAEQAKRDKIESDLASPESGEASPPDAAGYAAEEAEDAEDAEDAETDTVVPEQALISYVTELLDKGFPPPGIQAEGSRLDFQSLAAVRLEDTISVAGQVVDKREAEGLRLVECRVVLENQDGQRVAEATAVVAL